MYLYNAYVDQMVFQKILFIVTPKRIPHTIEFFVRCLNTPDFMNGDTELITIG